MPAESAAAAIAKLDGKVSTALAEVKGQLNLIAERLSAGDKESAQALAALQFRVNQLEAQAKEAEEREEQAAKDRRAQRNWLISALILSPAASVMTYFLTKALGG